MQPRVEQVEKCEVFDLLKHPQWMMFLKEKKKNDNLISLLMGHIVNHESFE